MCLLSIFYPSFHTQPASVIMQTHGSKDTKNQSTSFATCCIPSEREKALPLCLNAEPGKRQGLLLTEVGIKRKQTRQATSVHHTPGSAHSFPHDSAGTLRTVLIHSQQPIMQEIPVTALVARSYCMFLKE